MAVTGTGMFGAPLENMRTLLSVLSATQTWMSAADAAAAAAKIHLYEFDDPELGSSTDAVWTAARAAYRPLIVVGFGDNVEAEEDSAGPNNYWHHEGDLFCLFEDLARNGSGVQAADNTVTTADGIATMMNSVGAIIKAMEAAVSGGGYIDLTGWAMRDNPGRMPAVEVHDGGQLDLVTVTFRLDRRDM